MRPMQIDCFETGMLMQLLPSIHYGLDKNILLEIPTSQLHSGDNPASSLPSLHTTKPKGVWDKLGDNDNKYGTVQE